MHLKYWDIDGLFKVNLVNVIHAPQKDVTANIKTIMRVSWVQSVLLKEDEVGSVCGNVHIRVLYPIMIYLKGNTFFLSNHFSDPLGGWNFSMLKGSVPESVRSTGLQG